MHACVFIITKYRNRNEKTTQNRIRRILTKNKKSMNSLLLHVFIMVEPTPLLDPVPIIARQNQMTTYYIIKRKPYSAKPPPPQKKIKNTTGSNLKMYYAKTCVITTFLA
jgi:hypothetical protein